VGAIAMKKSMSVWSFPESIPIDNRLIITKEAGFDGFEMDLTQEGPVNLNSETSDLLAFRRLVERNGLELSGLASGLYWSLNGASESPSIREEALQLMIRQLQVAEIMGIDAILIVPGSVGVDFMPCSEVVPYEKAFERAGHLIRKSLPYAEKHRVKIGIENVWNKFLTSPLEMRSFIDQFDSEWVGAYFDVGNALANGYPEHWIEILGQRIVRMHWKDYRRAVGSANGFCDLLSGDVSWPEVIGAVRRISYNGWITAEMIPPMPFYKHCPEVLIHNTSRAMDAILGL
jgi:L-ribulose-5-phosphate 3-epimerase